MWFGLKVIGNFVCPAPKFYYDVNPSPRVIRYGKEYVRKWLNGSDYIAVVARLERVHLDGKNVSAVLDKALKRWTELKGKTKCNTTFLSLDVGRFGSLGTRRKGSNNAYLLQSAFTLFDKIYGNSISFDAWEESFVNVSGTTESCYISALLTAIASRARCVILVGGGEYQSRILRLYKNLHQTEPCHFLV